MTSWKAAAAVLLAALTAGCATMPGRTRVARELPPAHHIVADPAPRPIPRKGDDARVFARRALDFGDANAMRLEQARESYQAVADEFSRPE